MFSLLQNTIEKIKFFIFGSKKELFLEEIKNNIEINQDVKDELIESIMKNKPEKFYNIVKNTPINLNDYLEH
jgi:hypothetical protein